MKRLLCFLTGLLLIIGSANAQCITMNPSNFNAVADGQVHQYEISFPHANLNATTLYALKYELQFNGEVIPDAELGQYIDLDTCNISTHYSQYTTSGARITTSVGYFPSPDMPLELGFNLSGTAFNAFYGNYLTDPRESITFSIRWLRTGDYRLRLSLWSMSGGNCHDNISFHGLYHIGASNAILGSEVLNNDIVTPKELKDTTIYICYGETFTRGDWTVDNSTQWQGPDENGCDYIIDHLVHFYTYDGICANNRLDSTQKVTLMRRPAFTATLNNGNNDNRVICTGTSAGYVYMTIGGLYASNSTYTVSSGQNTIVTGLAAGTAVKVGNLSVGTYHFTVTDGNQCSIDVTGDVAITASQNANSYTINTTKTDVICNGASTGAISINSVTPGTNNQTATPYQYSWSNNATGASVSNLPAGDYTVVLTDNMGCTSSKTITINQNPVITSTKAVECCASALPYHYPTQGQDTIFTEAGTKVVKFTSAQGCDSLVTVTLTVNQNPVPTISGNGAVCKDGELTLTTETGMTGYTWTYTGATLVSGGTSTDNTITLKWAADGEKSVTVNYTDSHSCSAVSATSKTITVNPLPTTGLTVSPAATNNALDVCAGSTVTITAAEGYSYSWKKGTETLNETSNVLTLSDVTSSDAGSYSVVLTNSTTGCSATSDVIALTVNTPTIALNDISGTTTICKGGNTELTASTIAANTNGTVTYLWSTAANTANVTVTPTADSTFIVTATATTTADNGNCTATATKSVTVYVNNPAVTLNDITGTTTICNGGNTELTISTSANTGTVTYVWSEQQSTDATIQVSPTQETQYSVTATATNILNNVTCTVTATKSVTVYVNTPAVTLNNISGTTTICNGENTELTASTASSTGDVTYLWSTAATTANVTVTPTRDSTFTVTATATNVLNNVTCTATATKSVTVVVNTPAVALNTISDRTICLNDNTTLEAVLNGTPTGTVTYEWTPATGLNTTNAASVTATPATETEYTVVATATNTVNSVVCTATASQSVTVSINPLVELTFTGDTTQAICAGSNIADITVNFANATVAVTGLPTGISYNTITQKISGSCSTAGTYHYTVTATSNQTPVCDPIVKTGTITVNANPIVTLTTNSTTICSGADYTIEPNYAANTTLTYKWYKDNETNPTSTEANLALTNITAGATYRVVVTDGHVPACTAESGVFTINVNTNPTVHISTQAGGNAKTTNEVCLNDGFTLYAVSTNTASAYQWYKGTTAIANATSATLPLDATALTQSGSYTVKFIDNQTPNCEAISAPITVTIDTLPNVTISGEASVCANSTDFPTYVALTTIEGQDLTYAWSLSDNGSYPTNGRTINASWDAAASVTASVTVTDGNGCKNTATKAITVNALPTAEISTNNASICLGQESTILTATNGTGYQFAWSSSSETSNQIEVNPAVETTYYVTVTDGNGCKAKDSQTITINSLPVVSASADDNSICPGQQNATITATLSSAGTAGSNVTYAWYNGSVSEQTVIANQTTQVYTASAAGTYIVKVTDAENCYATSSVIITENTLPTVTISTNLSDNNICPGQENAVLTANGQGGNGTLGYVWKKNNQTIGSTATYTATAAGTYVVVVTDEQQCTATEDTVIVENDLPTVTIASTVPANVCKGTEVTISLNASNDVTSYSWEKGSVEVATTATYSFTANGDSTYTVTVATNNGCTATATYTGHAYELPTITNITHNDARCYGESNGNITVVFNGGQPGYTFTWTDDAATPQTLNYSTQNINNIPAGNYQLTITDNNGCKATSDVITVSEPDELAGLAATVDNVKCNGDNTGSITVTANSVTGGTTPYIYKLVKLGANQTETEIVGYGYSTTFSNLYAGDYKIYVKDDNGCIMSITKTVTEPNELTIAESATTTDHKNVSCNGLQDGQFVVTVTGGTAPFQYSKNGTTWSSATSNTFYAFENLTSNNYTVTVKDANGCTASTSAITISQPVVLSATITTATNLTCNGNQSGAIDLTVTGGTTDYTYSWSGPSMTSTNEDLSGLAAGTYTVTVTDAHQCTATTSVTLSEPVALTISEVTDDHQNVSCYNGNNGSITVAAQGGTGTYNYKLDNGTYGTSATFSSLSAGDNYVVTVKDANGCTASTSAITISQPTQLTISETIASHVNVDCYGNNTGSITVAAQGGTGTYNYKLDNGEYGTSATFGSLSAGSYVITVIDANECTASTSAITISQPAAALTATATPTAVSCYGGQDGQVVVTIQGGTSAYQINWNNAPAFENVTGTTYTKTNLSYGTYSYQIKDNNGCLTDATATVSVTQPTQLSVSEVVASHQDVDCYNASTGSITVSATGGVGNYTYSKDNTTFQASTTFGSLSANDYVITVKDGNNCTASTSAITISQPTSAPTASATPTAVSCNGGNDGQVSISISGGTEGTGYQYKWNNANAYTAAANNPVVVTGLTAGTYSYQIKDGNGCETTTATVTVSEPVVLTLSQTANTPVNCYGESNGSFTVTANGGNGQYLYQRSGLSDNQSNGTFTGLAVGNYTVTVTDAKHCTATTSVTITQPAQTTVTLTATPDAVCKGNSTTLVATGFTENANTQTQTAYYAWNNAAVTSTGNSVTPESTTTYTVTFTDAHLCTATASKTVTVYDLPVVAITPINDNVCPNAGTQALTANVTTATTGDYTYTWSGNGNMTISSTATTTTSSTSNTVTVTIPTTCGVTYTPSVVLTDGHNCSATNSTSVVVKDETYPTIIANASYATAGVSATEVGNCVYQVPDVTGSTYITVSDNCTAANNLTVTQSPAAGTVITQNTIVIITVTDGCNNEAMLELSINIPAAISITSTASTPEAICYGGNAELSAVAANGTVPANGYVYTWYNGQTQLSSTTVSPTTTTTYTVVATDANGCTATSTATVTVNELPVISTFTAPTNACPYDGSFDITANVTGGATPYTYTWSGATGTSATATVTESTPVEASHNYTVSVSVTDNNGCQAVPRDTTFTIKDATAPVITGTISTIHQITGCAATATSSYAALSTVAELESTFGLSISDNCTADDELVVSYSETNSGSCPIVVTRTYTVTDKCGNSSTVDETINVNVDNNITITGGTNSSNITCASDIVAPHTITPSIMPTVTDACGNVLSYNSNNIVESTLETCSTTKTYTYTYTDCADHSKTWTYTYNIANTFNAGEITTDNETICSGGNGAEITSVTAASGCSTITYAWYSSTDNQSWAPIANSNSATYTPTNLTQTTYFKRLASDACHPATASTGVYTVNVNEDIDITSHTADGSICPGDDYDMSVTATGGIGTLTYQWYAGTTAIDGATNSTYTATNINANTTYKCVVSGTSASGCEADEESVVVTLYTPATLTLTEDFNATALCPDSAFHFTATANLSNYEWKVRREGTLENCTDATGNTYVTYGQGGKFVVNATDEHNCAVHSDTLEVTRYEAPVGDGWAYVGDDNTHTTTNAEICKGTNITLVGFSATANTHIWTSGSETLTTTTFAPEASATYTVVSVDANGCKSNPTTVTVTVDTIPVVTLTGTSSNNTNVTDNITVCFYDEVSLKATSTATVNHWLFGNDSIIASNSITYIENVLVPEAAGRYIVYVKDGNNCVGSDTINFIIRDEISVVASSNATNGEICYGSDLTLDVTSTDITSFNWTVIGSDDNERNINNATTNGNAITFAADTTATYKVSGVDANNCPGYDEITVAVNELPTVTVSELANGIICADSAFHFTATSATATNYAWKYNNTLISGETATTLRDTRAGKYVVDVTDANGCTNHADTIATTVNALPVITLVEDNSLTTICADSAFHFTATCATATAYAWMLGENEIPGETTNTLRAIEAGTYTVEVKDANNCSNTETKTVTVNALPTVVLSEDNLAVAMPVICSDSAFHFTATVTTNATDPSTYTWKLNNVELTNNASTLRATDAGKYVVDVVDGNGCKSHSDTLVASVNPVPEVSVSHLDISCQNLGSATITVTSEGAYTCDWNHTVAIQMLSNSYPATNLTQGWYPYVITNTATNCVLIDSVYIDNPGLITATVTPMTDNNETCEGSDYIVSIVITGGNPNYTLEWVNDGQVVDDFITSRRDTIYNFSNLEDGDYALTLMVTDLDGCTGSTNNNFSITIHPSYHIVRDINIGTGQATYIYGDQQYTVPAVPNTYMGQTTYGCDSIISYELHQYDLEIIIADTCTMTRSNYVTPYANTARTEYGDTIYVKTGETAEFYAYIENTTSTTWNGKKLDMGYEVLYRELPIEDEDMASIVSALRFSTYYDRSGLYYGLDSVMSAQGEIPTNTFAFRQNLNSVIQHFDYFYFEAFKNVPNKVEFTPLENGTYTFKFRAEVRNSGTTGTDWKNIYNPYIVNRTHGPIFGGHDDTPASKDTIAARVFTVIATADGVAPTNAATDINEYSNEASVRTYPNPVRDQLNIRVSGMEGQTSITITDAQGKTIRVYNVNLDGSDAVMTYDMNGFAQGMYFINVRNNEKMISQKFILSK